MQKVVRLGTVQVYKRYGMGPASVFCKISVEGGRLSITGVEGPTKDGNAWGAAGQIVMHLKDKPETITPAPGWTPETIAKFLMLWDEWHLNDMRAGSPAQTAWIKAHAREYPGYPVSHYEWASRGLKAAGLNPDPNYRTGRQNALGQDEFYRYGSAWLSVPVPEDVLAFFASLPDADMVPAWV